MKNPYIPQGNFILRSPAFSTCENIENLFNSLEFRESLYLASPSFYKECKKDNFQVSDKRLKSLCKYYIRSTNRCTPFGLFAGCSIGNLAENTNIVLKDISNYIRVTRFDMNFLCALVEKVEKIESVKKQLIYYVNNSVYDVGEEIRYIEFTYKGMNRIHNITSVERSSYLNKILHIARKGAKIEDIASSIIEDDITFGEAMEFVLEIIDSQLLRSELDVHATGGDILEHIINTLGQMNDVEHLYSILKELRTMLIVIDKSPIGFSVEMYDTIIELVKKLDIPFDEKFLFQTDLFKPTQYATLSVNTVADIKNIIEVLNILNPKPITNKLFDDFKKDFRERYGDQEIPLYKAIDPELGIGYGNSASVLNPLIEGISFPKMSEEQSFSLNIAKHIIEKNIGKGWFNNLEIVLDKEVVKGLKPEWSDLPSTMNVCFSLIVNSNGEEYIDLKWIAGPSAVNILGRFCNLNDELRGVVEQISDWEQLYIGDDAILAAIAHLPNSRTGNILFRPNSIRRYEIPYLACSRLDNDYQIHISDLTISIKGNRIVLKSRRLQKEIIPRLDNAHNYRVNPTPLYQFLCDLQQQSGRAGLGIPNIGMLEGLDYMPRIRYENIILSHAKWRITYDEIKKDELNDVDKFREYRKARNIPKFVTIAEGDNELLIDCEDKVSLCILADYVKRHKVGNIVESLYHPQNFIVKNNNQLPFTNEIILPLFKSDKK